jgi:DnaJ-class molecular chaperone
MKEEEKLITWGSGSPMSEISKLMEKISALEESLKERNAEIDRLVATCKKLSYGLKKALPVTCPACCGTGIVAPGGGPFGFRCENCNGIGRIEAWKVERTE